MTTQCADVLYVDDNEADITVAKKLFSGNKFLRLTGIAHDGEEGLAYLRREGEFKDAPTPCLILLDINMPRMNGFELLAAIKAIPELCHIPVVMFTSGTLEQDIVKAYRLGACSYVIKPEDIDQYRSLVAGFEAYWTSISRVPSPEGV